MAFDLHFPKTLKIQAFPSPSMASSPTTLFSPLSAPKPLRHLRLSPKTLEIRSGLKDLRDRIDSVKSILKITEAMKLVSAAKVRRAQEAVINSRPFAQTLADLLSEFAAHLNNDFESPLTELRPVKRIAVVVVTSDRGLCGGFNAAVIRKAEERISELNSLGLGFDLISIGKKGNSHFRRKFRDNLAKSVELGNHPTAKDAQVIADGAFSMFVSEEVDKVEVIYTKFVSLVRFDPVIRTLLPLKPSGVDSNGNSVDSIDDELFRLTTKEGKLSLERESSERKRNVNNNSQFLAPILEFEQDPSHILDAMLPLYLNSQILRVLQEAKASELAARMGAMSSATDNAIELKTNLSRKYNRERQSKITSDILEIVAGAEALIKFD